MVIEDWDVHTIKTREIKKVLDFLELKIDPWRLECVKCWRFDIQKRNTRCVSDVIFPLEGVSVSWPVQLPCSIVFLTVIIIGMTKVH